MIETPKYVYSCVERERQTDRQIERDRQTEGEGGGGGSESWGPMSHELKSPNFYWVGIEMSIEVGCAYFLTTLLGSK